jgi:ABC-type glycerol-3-phosphate transport system permease component
LSEAGENFYSTLGFAAAIISFPLYAVFTTVSLGEFRMTERAGSLPTSGALGLLDELAVAMLFFGAILTHLSTAAFAGSLGKTRILGPRASSIFTVLGLVGALCVAIKAAYVFAHPHNPMWYFGPWYAFPGQVLSIPAAPWIMPCLLGLILLRRVGEPSN